MSTGNKYVQKWKGITPEARRETRQRLRADMCDAALQQMNNRFPGESRQTRRAMALSLARRDYRRAKGLPEPTPKQEKLPKNRRERRRQQFGGTP